MGSSDLRDLTEHAVEDVPPLEALLPRRRLVVVIGIDAYTRLPKLRYAVSDAIGVQKMLVEQLGFEAPIPPLLNEAATKSAIESLVEDDLRKLLKPDDALLFFFAGHGTTRQVRLDDVTVETGYLAPVDARGPDQFGDLVNMEELLRKCGMLPARHILVVLDACHSGMALGASVRQYRSMGKYLHQLAGNRSRRVITSARRDEPALDSGPVPGHSLFTGTLIHALTRGEADLDSNGVVTFSELALHLQQQVAQESSSQQTPDYGAFHLDDRGELILSVKEGALSGAAVLAQAKASPTRDAGSAPISTPQASELRAPASTKASWSKRRIVVAAFLGVALLGGAGFAAAKLFAPARLSAGEYRCRAGQDAMKSCRVAMSADGALHLRFEAAAIDATLTYDGPLTSEGGPLTCPLDLRFRGAPSLDERGRAGGLVLAPSSDKTWRGDWTYTDGSVTPFVLEAAAPAAAPAPTDPTPAPGSPGRPNAPLRPLDDFRSATRRAFAVAGQFDAAREFLSTESYFGRGRELAATGVVCRSYSSLTNLLGETLALAGFRRDNDAGGKAFDDPACSTYVKDCPASDCCKQFRCGPKGVGAKDTVKQVLRVCTHIKLSLARCDVTLVPYGAAWWLGEGVRIELYDGRDVMIEGAMKGLENVKAELRRDP